MTLDCSYLQVISFLQAQVGLQRLKGVDDVMQLGRTALKHCNKLLNVTTALRCIVGVSDKQLAPA